MIRFAMKATSEAPHDQLQQLQKMTKIEDLREIGIPTIYEAQLHLPAVANWADENFKRLNLNAWSTQNVTLLYMKDMSSISIDATSSSTTTMTIAAVHGNILVSGTSVACGTSISHLPITSCTIQPADGSEVVVAIDTVHKSTLKDIISSFSEYMQQPDVSSAEEKLFHSYTDETFSTGFIGESIRSSVMNSIKGQVLSTLDDSITFDIWLGSYLTRNRMTISSIPPKLSEYIRKSSVRSSRLFRDANQVLLEFMDNKVKLRRREDTRVSYMGRDDGRGMHTLFVNGESFFLPPPLNKFVGAVICGNRELYYEAVETHLPTKEDETEILKRVTLEASPFYRLLSALIQKGYLYPVDK